MPSTIEEASKRFCPFTFGGPVPADRCTTTACMAWHTVHPRCEREDHSGGRDMIMSEGVKTRRTARREGGPMSSGRWVLDEVGICTRLQPNT